MQTLVLTRQNAAVHLSNQGYSIKKSTLQKLASIGGGPRYRIFGNRAIYSIEDLDAWLSVKIGPYRKSTSVMINAEPNITPKYKLVSSPNLIAQGQHSTMSSAPSKPNSITPS